MEEMKKKKTGLWLLWELLTALLLAVLLVVFLQSFIFRMYTIPTPSMEDTLKVGDKVVCEKLTYYFRKPRFGDIVVFRYPPNANSLSSTNAFIWPFEQMGEILRINHRQQYFVKRVVGVEGDKVALKDGVLYVNGKRMYEDYIIDSDDDFGPVTVKKGRVFVMGDNRPNSSDSRVWGQVPLRSIVGKACFIWWPLEDFGKP